VIETAAYKFIAISTMASSQPEAEVQKILPALWKCGGQVMHFVYEMRAGDPARLDVSGELSISIGQPLRRTWRNSTVTRGAGCTLLR